MITRVNRLLAYEAFFFFLKKRQNLKMSSAAISRWRFNGYSSFDL